MLQGIIQATARDGCLERTRGDVAKLTGRMCGRENEEATVAKSRHLLGNCPSCRLIGKTASLAGLC